MNHSQYVADRIARNPRFEDERAAAAAELKFSEAVSEQRRNRKMTVEVLSENTGISVERLEAIEEGESATLSEALWLSHALDLIVTIDPSLQLKATVRPGVRLFGEPATTVTRGSRPEQVPAWSIPETSAIQDLAVGCAPAR